jgi:hypothetical protein
MVSVSTVLNSTVLNNVSSVAIGYIGAIRGEVLILRAQGGQAFAQKGDPIYQNDVVSTKSDAAVLVHAGNGGVLTLGHSAAVQFTPSLTQKIESSFSNGSLSLSQKTNLGLLEQLIIDGESIQELLPSTSSSDKNFFTSGGSATEDNADLIVVWQRTGDEIVPVSGFNAGANENGDFFGNVIGNAIFSNDGGLFGGDANGKGANIGQITNSVDAMSGESSVQTVAITINPANIRPEGTDKSVTFDEDSSYTILVTNFGFSDVVEGDSFTGVRIDSLPLLGSLTLAGMAVTMSQIISVSAIASGDLVFTPAANGNGAPYSNFTFSVQDSAGSIDAIPNTFTFNVTPISDLPVAVDDSYDVVVNTAFNTTLADGVLLNDSDADGDTLTVNTTPVTDVTGGVLVLNADGTFTYTPNVDFNGTDSFVYEISDGTTTTQATANITVDYVSSTLIGTSVGDNLIGAAASDDDIYSGGVSGFLAENVQGIAGTIFEAMAKDADIGSGNDRLIFDADDACVDDASSVLGLIRIRDFTVGDVTTDSDADTLVLGDFLRAGDPTFDGTAADAIRFLHFANDKLLYVDRDGGLGASGDAARTLSDGNVYHGINGGASLFLEFKGYAFDATPNGEALNSEAQIQQLMDLGFLDFS